MYLVANENFFEIKYCVYTTLIEVLNHLCYI